MQCLFEIGRLLVQVGPIAEGKLEKHAPGCHQRLFTQRKVCDRLLRLVTPSFRQHQTTQPEPQSTTTGFSGACYIYGTFPGRVHTLHAW